MPATATAPAPTAAERKRARSPPPPVVVEPVAPAEPAPEPEPTPPATPTTRQRRRATALEKEEALAATLRELSTHVASVLGVDDAANRRLCDEAPPAAPTDERMSELKAYTSHLKKRLRALEKASGAERARAERAAFLVDGVARHRGSPAPGRGGEQAVNDAEKRLAEVTAALKRAQARAGDAAKVAAARDAARDAAARAAERRARAERACDAAKAQGCDARARRADAEAQLLAASEEATAARGDATRSLHDAAAYSSDDRDSSDDSSDDDDCVDRARRGAAVAALVAQRAGVGGGAPRLAQVRAPWLLRRVLRRWRAAKKVKPFNGPRLRAALERLREHVDLGRLDKAGAKRAAAAAQRRAFRALRAHRAPRAKTKAAATAEKPPDARALFRRWRTRVASDARLRRASEALLARRRPAEEAPPDHAWLFRRLLRDWRRAVKVNREHRARAAVEVEPVGRRFRRRRGFLAWRRAAAAKRILDLAAGEKAARRLRKRRFQQWRSNADVVQETRAAACKALAHYLETARRRAFGAWRAAARQLFARRRFQRLGAGLARAARRPLLDAAAEAARGARAKETRDSAAALAFRRDKRKERAAQALQKWRRDVAALRARARRLARAADELQDAAAAPRPAPRPGAAATVQPRLASVHEARRRRDAAKAAADAAQRELVRRATRAAASRAAAAAATRQGDAARRAVAEAAREAARAAAAAQREASRATAAETARATAARRADLAEDRVRDEAAALAAATAALDALADGLGEELGVAKMSGLAAPKRRKKGSLRSGAAALVHATSGAPPPAPRRPATSRHKAFRALADCENRLLWLRTAERELDKACADRALAAAQLSEQAEAQSREADVKLEKALNLARELREAVAEAGRRTAEHEMRRKRALESLERLNADLKRANLDLAASEDARDELIARADRRNARLRAEREAERVDGDVAPAGAPETPSGGLPWSDDDPTPRSAGGRRVFAT